MISGLTSTSKKKRKDTYAPFHPHPLRRWHSRHSGHGKEAYRGDFFIDKDAPDAAENMLKVCCDALNAVAPTAPTPKAARERCGK